MICLTGDVHHHIGNPVQSFYQGSESRLALRYLEITQEYRIKTTLFISGKSFRENWEDVKDLLSFSHLEIGGHTYSALTPNWLHKAFKICFGSIYGPSLYQNYDIQKTLRLIEKKTGRKVSSWRTHSYKSDGQTMKILERSNVKVVSDELSKNKMKPYKMNRYNLVSLPINVLPDHEHVYYGRPARIKLQKEKRFSDVFTNESYPIEKYGEIVMKGVEEIEKAGGIATLLLHPQTMYLTDNFATFEKICKFIKERNIKSIWCWEAVKYID